MFDRLTLKVSVLLKILRNIFILYKTLIFCVFLEIRIFMFINNHGYSCIIFFMATDSFRYVN